MVGLFILIVLFNAGCAKTSGSSTSTTKPTEPVGHGMQSVIIAVGNNNITANYVIKRCLMENSDPDDIMDIIQSIIQERVIEQVAVKPPYNYTVTETDIDQELRNQANSEYLTNSTITLSDAEFQEWYHQSVNQSQLSEKEFRDLVKVSLLRQRLYTYLADRMPTTADQVHLWDIVVADQTTVVAIKQRIDNGEDFSTIAKELSIDANTSAQGGDMGWVPIKVLDQNLEYIANTLEIGKISGPVQLSTAVQDAQYSDSGQNNQPYYLLKVKAIARAKEVTDPQYISILKGRLLQDWLNTEMSDPTIKIALYGLNGSTKFDSETSAWLKYQIQQLRK